MAFAPVPSVFPSTPPLFPPALRPRPVLTNAAGPPQVLGRRGYDKASDLWSLGVVIFMLVTGAEHTRCTAASHAAPPCARPLEASPPVYFPRFLT